VGINVDLPKEGINVDLTSKDPSPLKTVTSGTMFPAHDPLEDKPYHE
jgi:hypothetical protein